MRNPRSVLGRDVECVPFSFMPIFMHQALVVARVENKEIKMYDDEVQGFVNVLQIRVCDLFEGQRQRTGETI